MSDEALRGHMRAIERELSASGRTWRDILPPLTLVGTAAGDRSTMSEGLRQADADAWQQMAASVRVEVMDDGRLRCRLSTASLAAVLFGPHLKAPFARVKFEGDLPHAQVDRVPPGKTWLGMPYEGRTTMKAELRGELIIEES